MATTTRHPEAASDGGRSAEPAVVARGVRRLYGEHGVHDLDLEVPAGRIFALIGPSGSGKSTTVRMLLGLEAPDAGELRVLGADPASFSQQDRQRIGYMPQAMALYRDLSLRHNLQFVASLYGLPWRGRWARSDAGKAARVRVQDTLAFLGLTDQQHTRLADASGGEQRRLALAAALIHEPSLLVLDEPTAGIDPMLRREIWDRLGELRDQGVTIFVTTQYVEEAAHCDVVAILAGGELIVEDTPAGLRQRAFGDEPPTDATFDDVFVTLLRRHEDEQRRKATGRERVLTTGEFARPPEGEAPAPQGEPRRPDGGATPAAGSEGTGEDHHA
jgi:ABC-2 type transport system ATP-binding protein